MQIMALATGSPAPSRSFSRNPVRAFYQSSIGKKITVAVTGIILILFVIGHLLGNLEIYLGQDHVNWYAEFLRSLGLLLWIVRIILLVTVVVHIVATIQLTIENRRAKPKRYAIRAPQASTIASRTMIYSGLVVLAFVIYHLLHFTFQTTNPKFRALTDGQGRHDVYHMVILGFRQPLVSFFYILALFLLSIHLSHGFASITQTLGINNQKISGLISNGGQMLSWLIFAGYASIPVTILLRVIK
jgi:succinate dehydrogenase / fumarate reductase, cytochrome b subunit